MIVKRNFPRFVRKLALLTILVFFAYQLLLFYDSRHKHEKNEEVKAVIVQEKLREKLEQIQKEADKPEVRILRKNLLNFECRAFQPVLVRDTLTLTPAHSTLVCRWPVLPGWESLF